MNQLESTVLAFFSLGQFREQHLRVSKYPEEVVFFLFLSFFFCLFSFSFLTFGQLQSKQTLVKAQAAFYQYPNFLPPV